LKKSNQKIAIIGGGISGIAASVFLIEKGYKVDIFETKKTLGGRAGSIQNKNINVDIGQHIFLPSYKNFLEVIEKLNIKQYLSINKNLNIPVQDNSKIHYIKSTIPLYPLNLISSVLNYKNLKFTERLKIIFALYKLSKSKDYNSKISFKSWLEKNGQNNDMIKKFWEIICVPAFNSKLNEITMNHAINLFKIMIFNYKKSIGICYFKKPFSKIIDKSFEKYIKKNESNIFLGEKIEFIKYSQKKISLKSKNKKYLYDKVIIATNINGLKYFNSHSNNNSKDDDLKTDGIINIYFWFNSKVIKQDFISFTNSKLEWIFSDNFRKSDKEHRVVISLSAVGNLIKTPNKKLILDYEKILRKELNISKNIKTIRSLVVRSPKATQTKTKKVNLNHKNKNIYYAGDWTINSLPNTMETAALSSKKLIDNYFK